MNTNEMTDLEMHLRSWAPRRPSKTLRHRLFSAPPRPAPPPLAHPTRTLSLLVSRFTLPWLTASAAALVLLALIHHPHSTLSPTKASPAILALALSNQAASATLTAASSNEQFSARAESLGWTNLQPLTSSVSPRSLTSSTN